MIIRFDVTLTNNTIGPFMWQFDPDEVLNVDYTNKTVQGQEQYKMTIRMRDNNDNLTIIFPDNINRDLSFDNLFLMMTMPPAQPENKFFKKEKK